MDQKDTSSPPQESPEPQTTLDVVVAARKPGERLFAILETIASNVSSDEAIFQAADDYRQQHPTLPTSDDPSHVVAIGVYANLPDGQQDFVDIDEYARTVTYGKVLSRTTEVVQADKVMGDLFQAVLSFGVAFRAMLQRFSDASMPTLADTWNKYRRASDPVDVPDELRANYEAVVGEFTRSTVAGTTDVSMRRLQYQVEQVGLPQLVKAVEQAQQEELRQTLQVIADRVLLPVPAALASPVDGLRVPADGTIISRIDATGRIIQRDVPVVIVGSRSQVISAMNLVHFEAVTHAVEHDGTPSQASIRTLHLLHNRRMTDAVGRLTHLVAMPDQCLRSGTPSPLDQKKFNASIREHVFPELSRLDRPVDLILVDDLMGLMTPLADSWRPQPAYLVSLVERFNVIQLSTGAALIVGYSTDHVYSDGDVAAELQALAGHCLVVRAGDVLAAGNSVRASDPQDPTVIQPA